LHCARVAAPLLLALLLLLLLLLLCIRALCCAAAAVLVSHVWEQMCGFVRVCACVCVCPFCWLQALVNIAAMGSGSTTRLCGSAIAELALRPLCFARVVADRGVPSVVSLAYDSDLRRCVVAWGWRWRSEGVFPLHLLVQCSSDRCFRGCMRGCVFVGSLEKCALALCNLSTYRPARDELMKVDAIDALATISSTGSELARRICRCVCVCACVCALVDPLLFLAGLFPPSGFSFKCASPVCVGLGM
jgi:hypothetical protein